MDKVLITGARGFVGSCLADLLEKDFEVIRFTRDNSLDEIKLIQPQYIIHCAAEIYRNELMFESNVVMTYNLLEICKNLHNLKHFVYIGSSSEYGRKSEPISEYDSLEPDSMYEGTKGCGSLLTRVYGKTHGFLTSIVRPFSLYGPKEQDRKFIPKLYDSFLSGSKISIKSGVHDWIHIDDFTNGIKLVMLQNNISGDSFHFGTGIQTTNIDIFKTMSKLLNKTIEYEIVESINGSAGVDSTSWVANIDKVFNRFNWTPKYNLEAGIQTYINYKNNGNS